MTKVVPFENTPVFNPAAWRETYSRFPRAELADDVFAGAMDGKEDAAYEAPDKFLRRGSEGLRVRAEPDVEDLVAVHPLMDAAGDGFHFGEFGHRLIIAG